MGINRIARSKTADFDRGSRVRVCLITQNHLSMNPRLVKEADALTEAGYSVHVVAADFVGWARVADQAFRDRPWKAISYVTFGPTTRFFLRVFRGLRRRLAFFLFQTGFRCRRIAESACHTIGPDLIKAAVGVKADLYIAHYPPALPAAALAAQRHGGVYAFDAEDFHLGDPPEGPEYDALRALIRAVEVRYLPGCAYISSASPGIAAAYAASYGVNQPAVIRNVFPKSHAPLGPTRAGTARPGHLCIGSPRPSAPIADWNVPSLL